ncbi:MAG: exodeoxyribonuclease VII small subunit [Gemmatimonadetes bacterium]|nr:exodeoxyribonuclease VII small subunit [Gemmatimonadota bacterium]MCH7715465.1 exodeoxyribonuclease VII small subunit [Gemmatimonadota bacterium]
MSEKLPPPSFRTEVERLETIVRSLEDSDVDLDEALALFQEGVERLKAARQLLQDTELTLRQVAEAADDASSGDDVED